MSAGAPAASIRAWWSRRGSAVLVVAFVPLALLAALKIASELHRLVAWQSRPGAIDLRLRHQEIQRWFSGLPVYDELARLTYPPQAYAALWPLLGWLDVESARWLWALTSIGALAWISWLMVRQSGATTTREKVLIVLMLLSMNAVGVTVGNGQLILHLLPALVAALVLLRRPHAAWGTDLLVAILLNVALVKPTLTLPFAFVILVAARRIRPLVLTAVLYLVLTLVTLGFQPTALSTLVEQWGAQSASHVRGGYGDIHSALLALGLREWIGWSSLLVIGALALWTYRRRAADLWLLVGVAALVARFWTYHRVYDDVLIVLAMLALFRVAKRGATHRGDDVVAALLLALTITVMLLPASMETSALGWLYVGSHVATWLLALAFLVRSAATTHAADA